MFKGIWVYGGQQEQEVVLAGPSPTGSIDGRVYVCMVVCVYAGLYTCVCIYQERMNIRVGRYTVCVYL